MTRRLIPHGSDAALNAAVLAAGEIAYADASGRPRFGNGGLLGGNVGAFLSDVILKADKADLLAAVSRIALVEGTVTSGRLGYATWAELAVVAAGNGTLAEVPITDTGTHTDPVVGGTVNNTGVFRRAAAGWQRIYDVAAASATAAATAAAASALTATNAAASITAGLPVGRPQAIDGALLGGGSWSITPPVIVTSADAVFNGLGFTQAAQQNQGDQNYLVATLKGNYRTGSYVAVSILVSTTTAGVWPANDSSGIRVLLNYSGTQQQISPLTIENIDSTHRRYTAVVQSTLAANLSNVLFQIAGGGAASIISYTGFAIAISDKRLGDVDYRDLTLQIPAASQPLVLLPKAEPFAGNLPSGFGYWFATPPTVLATVDTVFTSRGCAYAAQLTGGGASDTLYWGPSIPIVRSGDTVVVSVLVKKTGGGAWPVGTAMRAILYQNANYSGASISTQLSEAAGGGYETIDATHRRYRLAFTNATGVDVAGFLMQITASASSVLDVTGFAFATSYFAITDVDYRDWDAYSERNHEQRLLSVESLVGSSQAQPDLMIPTSYHLVIGEALRLNRDGLTSSREQTQYDIAAVGSNGVYGGTAYAAPVMSLDGQRFNGAGFVRAKKRGNDSTSLFQSPVTFYATAATKTGSFRYHHIGDSLTQQGITKALYDKLIAAGLTPTFVGTLTDAGGAFGEGRPNWKLTDHTYATRTTDATGTFYNVYPLRPNGGAGLTINAVQSGGAVTSATASGGTGYPPGIWEVIFGDPPNTTTGVRARGKITISAGGVPGAITIDVGGSGYTANPTGSTIVPSFAEYLANADTSGGYGYRWRFNPYLRVATAAEVSANDPRIKNGYIFDFAFYVTNLLGGTMPDLVTVMLGMNDMLKGNSPATAFAALQQIVTSIRAASATVPIAIAVPGHADPGVWALFVAFFKLIMGGYKAQEVSNKLFILPLFQVIDDKFVYSMNSPSLTDAQTGQQTVTVADGTHWDAIGRVQGKDMLFGWVMNRLP